MVLIYCHKITNRITYSVSLILETILGIDWQITDDIALFRNYDGARVQYGGERTLPGILIVQSAGFLHTKGIAPMQPEVKHIAGRVLLFPDHSDSCDLGFDIFSAAFFMASRYEEYLPAQKDQFGRFETSQSLAFREGFLHMPVVEQYAVMLKDALSKKFPGLTYRARAFRHLPTIDVDVAYAFKGRGIIRTLYGAAQDAGKKRLRHLVLRYQVLTGKSKDPFDTYDELLQLHKKYQLRATCFFLCGDYGPYDRNIGSSTRVFQELVKKMGDYTVIGVHPSMGVHDDPGQLPIEIKRLTGLLNQPVVHSRQHFLKVTFPGTYQLLLQHGITHDYSLGYASQPGFRAGMCTPFPFYDLTKECATKLVLVPLTVMDGTLRDYLRLKPDEALETIKQLILTVKEVEGTFVSLWHNDAYGNFGDWQGWRTVYDDMIHFAATLSREPYNPSAKPAAKDSWVR